MNIASSHLLLSSIFLCFSICSIVLALLTFQGNKYFHASPPWNKGVIKFRGTLLSKIRPLSLRGWAAVPNNRILDRKLEFKPPNCHTPKSLSLYIHFPSWGSNCLIKNTNLYQIKAGHSRPTNWLVGTRANFYKVTQHVLISSETVQCQHLQRKPYLEAIR